MALPPPPKPRRFRGTYAYTLSKYTALGCIGVSFGMIALYEGIFHPMKTFQEKWLKDYDRDITDAKQPLSFFSFMSTADYKKMQEKGVSECED